MASREDIKEGVDTLLENITKFTSEVQEFTEEERTQQTVFHNQFRMFQPSMEGYSMHTEISELQDALRKMDAELVRLSSNNSVRTPKRQKGGKKTRKGKGRPKGKGTKGKGPKSRRILKT